MNVEILIFGSAATQAQASRVTVTVSASPTVREITAALIAQHPALKFALVSPRLSVNHVFAEPETIIHAGDEIALITLVGGG